MTAARAGDRTAFGRLVERSGGRRTRTATGCSVRCPTPRTPSRKRCSVVAQSAALRGSQRAAIVAVRDRDQRLPEDDRAAARARAPDRRRTARGPARPLRATARRVDLDRSVLPRSTRPARRTRRPGGALRATREHRAVVHRGPPAPPSTSACSADPPRRPRIVRQGGRRRARHDPRRRLQRAAAGPPHRRRAPSRP